MGKKYLIVVDMQKDFITGPLGTKEAEQIVPAVAQKIREFDGTVIFTKDTHKNDYMDTQEGRNLPVPHCIRFTDGWELAEELEELRKKKNAVVYEKETFGCVKLAEDLRTENERETIESIELCGVCTDICVVSNALLIKANLPEVLIKADASCCAGVTVFKHESALETMRSCQIEVENKQ